MGKNIHCGQKYQIHINAHHDMKNANRCGSSILLLPFSHTKFIDDSW